MKNNLFLFFIFFFLCFVPSASAQTTFSQRLKGSILLSVEENGEAWYVNPTDEKRYYLGRPADAFNIMRGLGIGVSLKDMTSFYNNGFTAPSNLYGRILLSVEEKGEAWYVDKNNGEMEYLGRPDDAFAVMRKKGLGITNADLAQIAVGQATEETTNSSQNNNNQDSGGNQENPLQEYDAETREPIPLCTAENKCERYRNVSIYWDCGDSYLPASWKTTGNYRVTCTPVQDQYIEKSLAAAKRALDKYPQSLLDKGYLKRINLSGLLKFTYENGENNIAVGTVNIPNKAIYIVAENYENGTEQSIHHEFSSILLVWFDGFVDEEWKALNKVGFEYGNTRLITGAENLLEAGFVENYSMYSVENDVNTTVELLFKRYYDFFETGDYWANIASGKYPILTAKFNYLVNFYHQIDPVFTEEYFRKISQQ